MRTLSKLIISAALTGAEVTREQQPNRPIPPEEIAQAALEAYEAGASIVHVHARETNGSATQDKEAYRKVMDAVTAKSPVIFQPSTGGATWHTAEERLQPVELNPEMATLSTGTCNFGRDVFSNPQDFYERAARMMLDRGVKPEFEVFEAGMIDNALRLVKDGFVKPPLHFNFVLGVPGAMTGTVRNLSFLVDQIPADATWTVSNWSYEILAMVALPWAACAVGFEDNIYYYRRVGKVMPISGKVARLPRVDVKWHPRRSTRNLGRTKQIGRRSTHCRR